MKLNFGLNFSDICSKSKLETSFQQWLQQQQYNFFDSDLINQCTMISKFIAALFRLNNNPHKPRDNQLIAEAKFKIMQKRIKYRNPGTKLTPIAIKELELKIASNISQTLIASKLVDHFKSNKPDQENISLLTWVTQLYHYPDLRQQHADWQLFKLPGIQDFNALVELSSITPPKRIPGLALQDHGGDDLDAAIEANYCLYCHQNAKDSCRTGLKNRQGEILSNPLNNELLGCPLQQKISEMHYLKAQGDDLAALVAIMIDNPLVALTGYRICNDCAKACIFQKQEPVDTPRTETIILKNILSLEYGFEIYNLLANWHPLRQHNHHSPSKSLVVGAGPAGISAAYYLATSGVNVDIIDGMAINTINPDLITKPIKNFWPTADQIANHGFGGVAQYGITSRWDKRLLVAIRIILERYSNINIYGGIRYGSNVTHCQLPEFGYDHVFYAPGAGKPKILNLQNNLATGAKMAASTLMTINLQRPHHHQSSANLLIKLPIVVIGGGLTAIDCATEVAAYYPEQVLKFYHQYQQLTAPEQFLASLNTSDRITANTFLSHAKLYLAATTAAHANNTLPNYAPITKQLGGVKVIYHSKTQSSACYRQNHHELQDAINQGIEFCSNLSISEIIIDSENNVSAVIAHDNVNDNNTTLPAQTVLTAIGTNHNNITKPAQQPEMSIIGDANPKYHGSVVKAIASGRDAALVYLQNAATTSAPQYQSVTAIIPQLTKFKIASSRVFVTFKAKYIVENYKQGQIFKFQFLIDDILSEPIALLAKSIDSNSKTIDFEIKITGKSTRMLQHFNPDFHQYWLMGPIGQPQQPNSKLINVPMQCMMQGICAECLVQDHNGDYSFGCEQCYYPNNTVNHQLTESRLQQNRLLETLDHVVANQL